MSGPIVDQIVHVCYYCGTTWVEDDQMYEDPERCPKCGSWPDHQIGIEDDAFDFIGN